MKRNDGDTMQCPCCKECKDCNTGFHKVVDLRTAGLVIYRHTTETDDVNKDTGVIGFAIKTTEDVFIVHNTKDVEITSANFLPEIEQNTINCPRCRRIIEHAQKLLQNITTINRNEVKGICEHCRKKEVPCFECEEVVKKFVASKTERKENIKERVKQWLTKIKYLLKDAVVDTERGKERIRAHSELFIDQLCRDDDTPKPGREFEVKQMFHPETNGSDFVEAFPPSIDQRKKLFAHFPQLEKRERTVVFIDSPGKVGKQGTLRTDRGISDRDKVYGSHVDIEDLRAMFYVPPTEEQRQEKAKHVEFLNEHIPPAPFQSEEDFISGRDDNIASYDEIIRPIHSKNFYKSNEEPDAGTKRFVRTDKEISQTHETFAGRPEITPEDFFGKQSHVEDLASKPGERAGINRKQYLGSLKTAKGLHSEPSNIIRKYHSEESLLTTIAGVTGDVIKQDFNYVFPKILSPDKNKLKRQKSSSELIKATQDMLQAKAEEENKRLKEERKRKLEEEERKRIAQEERIKQLEAKNKANEERKRLEALDRKGQQKEVETHSDKYKKGAANKYEKEKHTKEKVTTTVSTTTSKSTTKESRSASGEKEPLPKKPKQPEELKAPREPKEPKAPTESREPKELKAPKEPKEPKGLKASKEPNKSKESMAPKESKEPKEPKFPKESKVPKALKEPMAPTDSKEPKDPKAPKEPKEPKGPMTPKESKEPKERIAPEESKEPKEAKVPKESKETKELTAPKELMGPKEPKGPMTPKESKEPKERIAPEESKEPKEAKVPKESKETKELTAPKELMGPKEPKELKEPNVPKELKERTAPKEPKEPTMPKDKKEPKVDKDARKADKAKKEENLTKGKEEKETNKNEKEKLQRIEKDIKQTEKDLKQREKDQLARERRDDKQIRDGAASKQKELEATARRDNEDADKRVREEGKRKFKEVTEAERDAKPEPEINKVAKIVEQPTTKELNIKSVKLRRPSTDDLILQLVKIKQSGGEAMRQKQLTDMNISKAHKIYPTGACFMYSDTELDAECLNLRKDKHEATEIIIGQKIFKYKPRLMDRQNDQNVPLFYQSTFDDANAPIQVKEVAISPRESEIEPPVFISAKQVPGKLVEQEVPKGVIRYALSDRTFIDKGWTMLPTEKVVRKMNVYRMRPAQPEFDWFEHNKNKRLIQYDTGEKLAEFDDNGRGRWFYRNGRMALDYYDAEELNAQQRFVIYSSGEQDERGRAQPYTLLATFDYLGNGIVFDHSGKIRLKYNQTEGVVLDRSIGPVSHWKWHTLNDPPVLQQVMIDTQMAHKDPGVMKLGGSQDVKTRPDNEDMLAIEFDNFIKEKSKKLTQTFKPFQIKMKALKINEHFSLKVLDQATVYLIFRDGTKNLKLNIGMVLDHKEIVDTDTAEVGEVSNSMERLPARTDSLAGLQKSIAHAQHYDRTRTERELRIRPTVPNGSADKLVSAASRAMRLPLRTGPSGSTTTAAKDCYCNCSRKPTTTNLYYDTRLC